MRKRDVAGALAGVGFVVVVAAVSFATQCPGGELGACARVHLELMRPHPPLPAVAAEPMRGAVARG